LHAANNRCETGKKLSEDGTCIVASDDNGASGMMRQKKAKKSLTREFWANMKEQGLDLRIRSSVIQEKISEKGTKTREKNVMVLKDDVFYGRHIMKIPRRALMSIESAPRHVRKELSDFLYEDKILETRYKVDSEDLTHMLSLAYPLILENRNEESVHRKWLDKVSNERIPVLELSEHQRKALVATTVEAAYDGMALNVKWIEETSSNFSFFGRSKIRTQEAAWALAVIMKHSRVVHPYEDSRQSRPAKMYIIPLLELLDVRVHPDPNRAVSFQEEILRTDGRNDEVVLQIARRDMAKGEEVFVWAGRLSNSDMSARFGVSVGSENPIGIGANVSQPASWDADINSKTRKEFAKYNCSTLEAFELRVSTSGRPSTTFLRCYRVSWFIANGWYNPGLQKRLLDLNRWPPPKSYKKDDWLAWTQADADLVRALLDYCRSMRKQLKESMDSALATQFRNSANALDKLVWSIRIEESKTFKACEEQAIKASDPAK